MNTYSFSSLRTDGLTLVLGLGVTGVAAAVWCAARGANLRVVDTRVCPPGLEDLHAEVPASQLDLRFGPECLNEDALQDVHTIVLSPGLSPAVEPIAGFLKAARERGVQISSEIELFALALRDMAEAGYQPQVLAITGTNGKTTVTALTRHLVEASGRSAVAAGNIGPAALTALRTALATGNLPQVWVLELSSFQIVNLQSLRARAGVVLNISQDHLDWHGGMSAYVDAKARLLDMVDLAIVNRDDPLVAGMVARLDAPQVVSFGCGLPELKGDLGLEENRGMTWLVAAESADVDMPAPRRRRGGPEAESRPAGRLLRLVPADALRLRGQHNALNALAALALARCVGAEWAPMLHALRDYAGEPHRSEFVQTIAGVDYINDSKGTNVGATLAALKGMGRPVVLIAGGQGKGQDFSPLLPVVREHARAVILIGADAAQIEQALAAAGVPIEHCASLEAALRCARRHAQEGDAVLLSPACASLDMFENYGHRGRCFVDAVYELARDEGVVL